MILYLLSFILQEAQQQPTGYSQGLIMLASILFSGVVGASITGLLNLRRGKQDDIATFRKQIMDKLAAVEAENDDCQQGRVNQRVQLGMLQVEHEMLIRTLPPEQAAAIRREAQKIWVATAIQKNVEASEQKKEAAGN